MLRVHLSCLNLEGLQESLVVHTRSIFVEETACHFSLNHNVLMKENYLVLEISPDHFFQHPDVSEVASVFKDDLHFSL